MTAGTVGEVVKSNHPNYKVGDIVEDRLGWQEYGIGPSPAMRKIDPSLAPISTANGVLGMPGMTAYFGLSPRSLAAAPSASRGARRSAPSSRTRSASMPASTTRPRKTSRLP